MAVSQLRVIMIGGRLYGKSVSGNTILNKETFERGRIRTTRCDLRHGVAEGRELVVVDTPGWSSSLSLTDIPEVDKERFKLCVSKCPPGPHAFLLTIPVDSAFTMAQRKTLEEYMKLLGERAWRNTMVLFTYGDFLAGRTIEQHIENEGEALRWLVQRCGNRYHVFDNKDKDNTTQVKLLLEKLDKMVQHNNGGFYQADQRTLQMIEDKQRDAAQMGEKRRKEAEEKRQQMRALIPKAVITELRIVLLGSRSAGKTSLGNTILGIKMQEDGKRTTHSTVRQGYVDRTSIVLVDTPGWWKSFSVFDTPEMIKQDVMGSLFLCPPGPHVFLLAVDADAAFNSKHGNAVTGHLELLGEDMWKHTMVVFTRGDWLGAKTIEEYIEGEGKVLQSLVDRCANRYHVIDNMNRDDGTQVTEILEKIREIVDWNGGKHFVPDVQIKLALEEKKVKVEEGVKLRQSKVENKRMSFKGSGHQLPEIRIVMLGQKAVGKSAAGNIILRNNVFCSCKNAHCLEGKEEVAGKWVTVIDTPGWWKNASQCTEDIDREIVKGVSLCPAGVHALLLAIPLDMAFTEEHQKALEEHMGLFSASVWKHTLILFTYEDVLKDISIEEYIERERNSLQWLVDKCENRYHVFNNTKKTDTVQVTELLEKIEEMVAGNSGQLFSPDMSDVQQRIEEKFKRKELKQVLKQRLEQEYRRRELELLTGFKQTLINLQAEIRGDEQTTRSKSLYSQTTKAKTKGIHHRKKDGIEKEDIEKKINQEIQKLDKNIMRSTDLRGSMDIFVPSLSGGSPTSSVAGSLLERQQSNSNFDKVLHWLSTLEIRRNLEEQLTLNFSSISSGYSSRPAASFIDSVSPH